MSEVRILNASLEEDETHKDRSGNPEIILRGVIDQATLKFINMDWYQRERGFSPSHTNEITSAYFNGHRLPDITLGMRGHRCKSRGENYMLLDKVYCVDGGQRLYAAAIATKERPDLSIRIGAKVFFGTTEESENDMFCQLGTTQVRIAPSVIMRNRKKKSVAANMMVEINEHPDFALRHRVVWDQVKKKHDLIGGFTFARIVGMLHAHKVGAVKSARVTDLLHGLDHLVELIGEDVTRQNIIMFFDAIDKCWTIRNIGPDSPRPHLRPLFLMSIARLVSSYPDFWDAKDRSVFQFSDKYVRKLRSFRLAEVIMSTSTVMRQDILFALLRDHLGLDPLFGMDKAAE